MAVARKAYAAMPVRSPYLARWLLADPRSAWLWLAVRLYVGWAWFEAGRHKIWPETGPSWLDNGNALKSFWQRAVAVPDTGPATITYGWYRQFLQYMLDHEWYTWFAKVIAIGELAVGIALIAGAFVGIAAFFGTFMNFNFMLAGSASTNPVLFGLAIFLVLAWRVGGLFGLDRFLLPLLKTPWQWAESSTRRRESRPGPPAEGRT